MATKKHEIVKYVRKGKSAAEKQLDKLRETNKRQRAKAKEGQDEMRQMAIAVAMAFALGYAARMGWLARIPRLGGLPVLATTGVGGVVAGYYVDGTLGDVLMGVGVASLLAAAYQLGSEGTVSGGVGAIPQQTTQQDVARAINQLRAELQDGDDQVAGGQVIMHAQPVRV